MIPRLLSLSRSEETRSVFGFAGGYRAPEIMQHSHLHQEVEINFITAGAITYLMGGKMVDVTAREFVIFWAAVPHRVIRMSEGTLFHWFTVPLSWLLQWGIPESFMIELLRGGLFSHTLPGDADLLACERWQDDLDHGDPQRLHIAQLEIEARIQRLALADMGQSRRDANSSADKSSAMKMVGKMILVIATSYTTHLTIEDIVAPTGLHPNYGMSLFRKACGLSIMEYLNQHRIFHARRLLVMTDRTILDIAMASGFGSQSRFYQAFGKACGCSPGEFRKSGALEGLAAVEATANHEPLLSTAKNQ